MLTIFISLCKLLTADGSNLWGQKAKFTGGTHDWEFSETTFTITKDIVGMALYALYRNDPLQGSAYFDDISVNVIQPLHTQNYGNVIENGACVSNGDRLPYNSIVNNNPVEGSDGLSHDCANFCHGYRGVDGYVGFSLRFKGQSNDPRWPVGRCQCQFKQGTIRPDLLVNGILVDISDSTSVWWGSEASNNVDLAMGNGNNDYVCYPYKQNIPCGEEVCPSNKVCKKSTNQCVPCLSYEDCLRNELCYGDDNGRECVYWG